MIHTILSRQSRVVAGGVTLSVMIAAALVALRGILLGPSGFPVHGVCWRWDPALISLHLGGDLLVWSAYMFIPALVVYLLSAGHGTDAKITFPGLQLWGAAFIWCCGITHLLDAVEIWRDIQWARGAMKLVTGVISWIFLSQLFRNRLELAAIMRAVVSEEARPRD